MKQHFKMVQKQKILPLLSFITGTLFLLFTLFHSALVSSAVMPGHHGSQTNPQHNTAISCMQQCAVLGSEDKLQTERDEEADPLKPFEILLASASLLTGILYLAPHTVLLVKRKLKVPIYKQVACYRI